MSPFVLHLVVRAILSFMEIKEITRRETHLMNLCTELKIYISDVLGFECSLTN